MADSISPTPRNRLLGMLADAVRGGSDFVGTNNPPVQMLMNGLGVNDLGTALDHLSYGEPLTSGKGQTTRLNDEVPGALGALLPGATAVTRIGPKAAQLATDAAAAGARNLAVPRTMSTQAGKILAAEPPTAETRAIFDNSSPLGTPTREQAGIDRYQPPRGLPDRVARLADNQGAQDKIAEWMAEGMNDNGLGWYNMEPLKQQFVSRLGPDDGEKQFNRYIDLMAATSAGAKTDANARIASYYYVNGADGQPLGIPPIGSGYGHKAQNLHNANANGINAGYASGDMSGGLDPIQNPKRFTFAENLKGNLDPVTVDKHNIRAWGMASRDPEWVSPRLEDAQGGPPSIYDEATHGPWDAKSFSPRAFVQQHQPAWETIPPTWFEGAPKSNEYGELERLNQGVSDNMGVLPAQGQAALWLGAGPTTGLGSPPMSMMNTFQQMLAKRAAARGESPDSVLDQFIRGVRPLMVPAAGAGVGAAMYGGQDDQQQPY